MNRGGRDRHRREDLQSLDFRWSKEIILPPRIILQLIRNLKLFAEPNDTFRLRTLEMVDDQHLRPIENDIDGGRRMFVLSLY